MTDPSPSLRESSLSVLRLAGGLGLTEIRPWNEPAASARITDAADWRWAAVPLSTLSAAEYHLRGLMRNGDSVRELRILLGREHRDVQRLADGKVLSEVATLLACGRLVLYEARRPLEAWIAPGGGETSHATATAAPAARRAPTPSSPSPVASPADPEPDDMNHDAQAATLRAAARDAVPFCEVCARLAATSQEAVPA